MLSHSDESILWKNQTYKKKRQNSGHLTGFTVVYFPEKKVSL